MPTRVDGLIEKLAVIDENIGNEAIRQPLLFVEAARYRVSKMRVRSQAEAALEHFAAQYGLRVRASEPKAGERMTEGYVKARTLRNTTYKGLKDAVLKAERDEEFSKLLLEAYRMRRDAIKIVAEAQSFESMRSVGEVERNDAQRKLSMRARRIQAARERAKISD